MAGSGKPVFVESGEMDKETYEYAWKVHNLLKLLQNEELHSQQQFIIETGDLHTMHTKWVVSIRKHETNGEYMYLTCNLEKVGENECVEAIFQLRYLKPSTDIQVTLLEEQKVKKINEKFVSCFPVKQCVDSNGDSNFLISLTIFSPNFSPSLALLEQRFYRQSIMNVQNNFVNLFAMESCEYDVKIVCSDRVEIQCHKEILKANSPVFNNMLESGLLETQTGKVDVTDVSGKPMKLLVYYMYNGKLKDYWKDPEIIFEFTYAVVKYQLATVIEYLDKVLGSIDGDCKTFLIPLKNLTGKLSLATANTQLIERIAKFAFQAKNMERNRLFESDKIEQKNEAKEDASDKTD